MNGHQHWPSNWCGLINLVYCKGKFAPCCTKEKLHRLCTRSQFSVSSLCGEDTAPVHYGAILKERFRDQAKIRNIMKMIWIHGGIEIRAITPAIILMQGCGLLTVLSNEENSRISTSCGAALLYWNGHWHWFDSKCFSIGWKQWTKWMFQQLHIHTSASRHYSVQHFPASPCTELFSEGPHCCGETQCEVKPNIMIGSTFTELLLSQQHSVFANLNTFHHSSWIQWSVSTAVSTTDIRVPLWK